MESREFRYFIEKRLYNIMVPLKRAQRIILRDLLKSGGKLDAFTFYRKYGFSPDQLLDNLKRFLRDELIRLEGNFICLTKKGESWILNQDLNFVPSEKEEEPWKEIPEQFRTQQIEPKQPYIPSIDHLYSSFFPKSTSFLNQYRRKPSKS